jgi:hypothetical protein
MNQINSTLSIAVAGLPDAAQTGEIINFQVKCSELHSCFLNTGTYQVSIAATEQAETEARD